MKFVGSSELNSTHIDNKPETKQLGEKNRRIFLVAANKNSMQTIYLNIWYVIFELRNYIMSSSVAQTRVSIYESKLISAEKNFARTKMTLT